MDRPIRNFPGCATVWAGLAQPDGWRNFGFLVV